MDEHNNSKNQLGNSEKEYELLEEIGNGGFANVRKAKCRNTGRLVAIKKINLAKKNNKVKERIRHEIDIQSGLKHKSIVQLYTSFRQKECIYIVLELCSIDLEKYRRSKPKKRVDESEARRFLSQILDGMIYLNDRNILHRDLKLSNILLSFTGEVKIADFGLATKLKGKNDIHTTVCGTLNYMSPEIFSGAPQTPQMDVWSLGVMLYTMLIGEETFASDRGCMKETKKNIQDGEYNLKSYLSQDSSDLIKKCISLEPSERIQLRDMPKHSFLAPIKYGSNANSLDSGQHTGSMGGTDTQLYKFGQSTNRLRSNSPPVRMISNPSDVLNPIQGNSWTPYPALIQPSCPIWPSKMHSSSPDYLSSSSQPMRVVHPEVVSDHMIPDFKVEENSAGLYYRATTFDRERYPQIHYSRNILPVTTDKANAELSNQASSCCQASRQENWHGRRDDRQNHYHRSDRNVELHSNVLSETNRVKVTSADNCHTSLVKSQLSREGTILRANTLNDRPLKLTSMRLKIIREIKEHAVLSILKDSEVCIEYLKKKKTANRVIEVLKVSSDGNDIVVYRPNNKEGVSVGDCPPKEQGDISRYTYDSLPQKLWKKYSNAFTFVEQAKEKTPKITDRNKEPKAYLMENGNVEAVFKNGHKFVFSSKCDAWRGKLDTKINLTRGNHTYTYNIDDCSFNEEDALLYEQCCKVRDHLMRLEKKITEIETESPDFPIFPLLCGPRPETVVTSTSKDTRYSSNYSVSNKENIHHGKKISRHNLRR